MTVFAIGGYEKPLFLRGLPEPSANLRGVGVAITASSLNSLYSRLQSDALKEFLRREMPLALRHDLAGTVAAVNASGGSPFDVVARW